MFRKIFCVSHFKYLVGNYLRIFIYILKKEFYIEQNINCKVKLKINIGETNFLAYINLYELKTLITKFLSNLLLEWASNELTGDWFTELLSKTCTKTLKSLANNLHLRYNTKRIPNKLRSPYQTLFHHLYQNYLIQHIRSTFYQTYSLQ